MLTRFFSTSFLLVIICLIGLFLKSAEAQIGKPEFYVGTGHSDGITEVTLSPNGKWLVSGSWDGTTKIWDIVSEQEIKTFNFNSFYDFSPSGNILAIQKEDEKIITLWNLETGKKLQI